MKQILFVILVVAGLALSSCGGAKDCDCPNWSQQTEQQQVKG